MEDLATARISVAQIAQRVVHSSVGEDTERVHDLGLMGRMVRAEGEDIVRMLGTGASQAQVKRYQSSVKIALRWIKNYTEFDFRSLGSYSRPELEAVAAESDPTRSKRVSNRSLCPMQYRTVRALRDGPVRLVDGRFFGSAQNHYGLAKAGQDDENTAVFPPSLRRRPESRGRGPVSYSRPDGRNWAMAIRFHRNDNRFWTPLRPATSNQA